MSSSLAPLFQRLTHGVYVIGVTDDSGPNAFTAAWVMQISYDPLLLALSINTRHASYATLVRSGVFSVNVLRKNQLELAAHFGKPAAAHKLASVPWTTAVTGAPLLNDAVAWLECRVTHEHPLGVRALIVGEVVNGALLDADADPMTYRDTGDLDGSAAFFPETFPKP